MKCSKVMLKGDQMHSFFPCFKRIMNKSKSYFVVDTPKGIVLAVKYRENLAMINVIWMYIKMAFKHAMHVIIT